MSWKFLAWSLILAICTVRANATQVDDTVQMNQLRAEKKAVIFIYSNLYPTLCAMNAVLAKRDGSGRYVQAALITLRGSSDYGRPQVSSSVMVPAGEYGIVSFSCNHNHYSSPVVQQGNFLARVTGQAPPTIYAKPLAVFRTNPGEVVDVGSIRFLGAGLFQFALGGAPQFSIAIEPTPQEALQRLAEKVPHLFRLRVVRPMVAAK